MSAGAGQIQQFKVARERCRVANVRDGARVVSAPPVCHTQVVANSLPPGGTQSFNTSVGYVGGVTDTNIVGLTPGASYSISVRAENTAGEALFSPPLPFLADANVPDKMDAPTSAGGTSTSYTLNWASETRPQLKHCPPPAAWKRML
jgi:hypothetical protein